MSSLVNLTLKEGIKRLRKVSTNGYIMSVMECSKGRPWGHASYQGHMEYIGEKHRIQVCPVDHSGQWKGHCLCALTRMMEPQSNKKYWLSNTRLMWFYCVEFKVAAKGPQIILEMVNWIKCFSGQNRQPRRESLNIYSDKKWKVDDPEAEGGWQNKRLCCLGGWGGKIP